MLLEDRKTKNLMVRISEDLNIKLSELSSRLELSNSDITRLALKEFIKRYRNKQCLDGL